MLARDENVLNCAIRALRLRWVVCWAVGCANQFGGALRARHDSGFRIEPVWIDYLAARRIYHERGFGDGRSVHESLEV